jgi:NAD(P)-dependent dehydrogenase (short-subunit alcohol dehydrogenase family)
MARTVVVSGSASGMGQATADRLRTQGDRVIGVDLHDAEVRADLSTPAGRAAMVGAVEHASGGVLDAVIACAGIAALDATVVRVNYFGAVATVDGLRPMLARAPRPRAVVVASSAVLDEPHPGIVDACLAFDEELATRLADEAPELGYASAKRALARWVRRVAPTPDWAGEGIPINAIAPGTIITPMTEAVLADPEWDARLAEAYPMPLHGRGRPEEVAPLLTWLVSVENCLVTGQCIFIDGGNDVVLRGDDIW